jgi:hypothetical protein
VVKSLLEVEVVMEGDVKQLGVKSWLGWEPGVPAPGYARDMKQLPAQRPKDPLKVQFQVDTGKGSIFK